MAVNKASHSDSLNTAALNTAEKERVRESSVFLTVGNDCLTCSSVVSSIVHARGTVHIDTFVQSDREKKVLLFVCARPPRLTPEVLQNLRSPKQACFPACTRVATCGVQSTKSRQAGYPGSLSATPHLTHNITLNMKVAHVSSVALPWTAERDTKAVGAFIAVLKGWFSAVSQRSSSTQDKTRENGTFLFRKTHTGTCSSDFSERAAPLWFSPRQHFGYVICSE